MTVKVIFRVNTNQHEHIAHAHAHAHTHTHTQMIFCMHKYSTCCQRITSVFGRELLSGL
jgi:hypothetical protein